jgi:hypothetical protein
MLCFLIFRIMDNGQSPGAQWFWVIYTIYRVLQILHLDLYLAEISKQQRSVVYEYIYWHVLRMGSVTNNTMRVRVGYWIYSLWRFTAAHSTITENILTLALVASWILLSERHCTDSLTRTKFKDQLA